jgi:hypothetical protein
MNTRKICLILIGNIYSAPVNNITLNIKFSNELATKSVCTITKTKCYDLVMTYLNYRCKFGVERKTIFVKNLVNHSRGGIGQNSCVRPDKNRIAGRILALDHKIVVPVSDCLVAKRNIYFY